MKNILRISLQIIATIILFDLVVYHTIPDKWAAQFYLYKVSESMNFKQHYPQNYSIPDDQDGFDIKKNAEPNQHYVNDLKKPYMYDIWSNTLGCFDIEHENLEEYIYLAGDSFTWGYTSFENKFGTLLQSALSIPVVKCGVTHTGQIHQLNKAKEVIEEIGIAPKLIITTWIPNDPVNDYTHPHSMVIDGWLVDNVYLDSNNNPIKVNEALLKTKMLETFENSEKYTNEDNALKGLLKRYSISSHLINKMMHKLALKQEEKTKNPTSDSIFFDNKNRPLKHIYDLSLVQTEQKIFPYKDNIHVLRNKEALINFQKYAIAIGSEFLLVLESKKPNHLSEVRQFLEENGITYLDLGLYPKYRKPSLFWPLDGHWNEKGNRVVADILYDFLQAY